MSIPTSTAPGVKAWLAASIGGWLDVDPLAEDPAVLVSYDEPIAPNQPDDVIIVGDIVQEQQPHAMVGSGGAGFLYETYTVEIEISIYHGGDLAQQIDTRLWHIHAQLAQAIRADPSLGGQVLVAYLGGMSTSTDVDENETGRVTTGITHLHAEAQI